MAGLVREHKHALRGTEPTPIQLVMKLMQPNNAKQKQG
jgi:hypothetical protein